MRLRPVPRDLLYERLLPLRVAYDGLVDKFWPKTATRDGSKLPVKLRRDWERWCPKARHV